MAGMAEIMEAAEEAIDGAAEGAEEGAEELSEEAAAETEAEITESRTAIEELSTTQSKLQNIIESLKSGGVSVIKFVGKTAAIGVILWAVNAGLDKMFRSKPKESQETKTRVRNVIKALNDVIQSEGKISHKVTDWMTAHQDDTISLSGFEVPLESILIKYIQPLQKAGEDAEAIANSLQETVGGKVQFKCPTADDIRKLIDVTDVFITAFTDIITFIVQHEDQVKELQSFPIKQADVIELAEKLGVAKALPLW